MGRFDELIETMQNPGENGIPDSIYDDLRLARDDEVAAYVQAQDGATSRIQELEASISKLKTQNYDLLMSAGSTNPETGSENDSDDTDGESENDDDDKGIDSLFGS